MTKDTKLKNCPLYFFISIRYQFLIDTTENKTKFGFISQYFYLIFTNFTRSAIRSGTYMRQGKSDYTMIRFLPPCIIALESVY